MFDKDKKISNRNMLMMGSLFVATPVLAALFKRRDSEERAQRTR